MKNDDGQVRRGVETGISLALAGVAFYGSFHHWTSLLAHHGQSGAESIIAALCVDVGVYRATLARQHDAAIGRKPKGLCSFPTLCLFGGIILTLAGNVATAQPTVWGVIGALIPGAELLMSIGLSERQSAEDARRMAIKRAEARARREEQEAEQARQADRDRQRREAREEAERLQAERERKRQDAERERHERERRRTEFDPQRHDAPSLSRTGTVTANVTAGGLHVAPPPEARAKSPERIAMWAHWVHAIKTENRLPSGEQLRAAGGCNVGSAAGRIAAKEWRLIEPARSFLQREATGS